MPISLTMPHETDTTLPSAVYVHEEEFKHATWSVATKTDSGVYLASYLSLTALNWQTFSISPFARITRMRRRRAG